MTATAPLARLVAWEAVTSLGETASETAVLLRAGLINVGPSRFVDASGERVMVCAAPALAPELMGAPRAAELARLALTKLDASCPRFVPAAILVAVSDRYVDESAGLNSEGQALLQLLRASLPPRFGNCRIEFFPYGPAGGAVALRRALTYVADRSPVVWGGIDTWYDWPALEALEQTDRLMTIANIDGIRPGEGAAFLALGPAAATGVNVLAFGLGREPHPIGSEQPCRSLGLSDALSAAVEPLRLEKRRTNCWLLDATHEAYATQELQNIIARFGDVLGLQTELQMPLKELGDVGAAAMPLLAILGAEAWRLGVAEDDRAVVTGCSRDGARGAILLAAPEGYRSQQKAERITWAL